VLVATDEVLGSAVRLVAALYGSGKLGHAVVDIDASGAATPEPNDTSTVFVLPTASLAALDAPAPSVVAPRLTIPFVAVPIGLYVAGTTPSAPLVFTVDVAISILRGDITAWNDTRITDLQSPDVAAAMMSGGGAPVAAPSA